jgi:hypothetical protein
MGMFYAVLEATIDKTLFNVVLTCFLILMVRKVASYARNFSQMSKFGIHQDIVANPFGLHILAECF